MYGTLEMMKQIITGKENEKSEIELIEEYKNNSNPSILAYFYVKNFGIIKNTSDKYKYLISEDKASYCLQELDLALFRFNVHSNNLFITYFIKCYRNRLRVETQYVMTLKSRINIIHDSISNYENKLTYNENVEILLFDKHDLNDREKKLIDLLYFGYSVKEISKLLKVSCSYIYKINSNLRKKLLNEV